VAAQLAESQRTLGWDARLLTLTHSNLRESPLSLPVHTLLAGVDDFALRAPDFDGLISLNRDLLATSFGEEISGAAIIHLHWINGVTSLERIAALAPQARVVWTLHDMNPFTGACHQSFGCTQFTTDCSQCPAVRSYAQKLVAKGLAQKASAHQMMKNLTIVTPSRWLQSLARKSHAMKGHDIRLIANPVRDIFGQLSTNSKGSDGAPKALPTTQFCLVAKDLDDPLKNVDFAANAHAQARTTNPDVSLVLVGKNGDRFKNLSGVTVTGELGALAIRDILVQSCALLLPSLAENAPMVMAEAACVGTPTIAHDIAPLSEMVETLGYGSLVSTAEEMADEMLNLLAHGPDERLEAKRGQLASAARELFGASEVAARYLDIYRATA